MPDPAPLELKPDELKQIRKGLEDIGETLNVAVDEQNSDIENKDEQTEKIIKDNIIDKTRIILKPDEKKRYLAISKIFIDEWMSQVKILKESEKKKGLLSGAISLVKKTGKKAWDLMKLPFWWLNKDKKEDESSPWWEKILKLLAGIGVFWFFFGDNIKNLIPDNVKEALKSIGESLYTEIMTVVNTSWSWLQERVTTWWEEAKKELGIDTLWEEIRKTCATIRLWLEHPWKGLAKELSMDDEGEVEGEQVAKPEQEIAFLHPKVENVDEQGMNAIVAQDPNSPTKLNSRNPDVQAAGKVIAGEAEQTRKVIEEYRKTNAKRKAVVSTDTESGETTDVDLLSAMQFLKNASEVHTMDNEEENALLAKISPVMEATKSIMIKGDIMENIKDTCLRMVAFFEGDNGGVFGASVNLIVGRVEKRLNELANDIAKLDFQNVYSIKYIPTYKDTYDESDHSTKEIINDYSNDQIDKFDIKYNYVDFADLTATVARLDEQEEEELKHLKEQTDHLRKMVRSIDDLSVDISQMNETSGAASAAVTMSNLGAFSPNRTTNTPTPEFLRDAQKKYAVVFNDGWKETYGGLQTT